MTTASEFAISSLESLTDQVSHFILRKQASAGEAEPPQELDSSFLQLRDLILETQMQFSRMEDKKRLQAALINETLQQTNEKVLSVKAELKQLAMVTKPSNKSEGKTESLGQESMEVETVRRENVRLTEELEKTRNVLQQTKELNQKLTNNNDATAEQNQTKAEVAQLKRDLNRCQEQIRAMKLDQKRLKIEKLDLLGQMRQLYGTLEDKETELRDFINIYEQRLTESENIIKQTAKELKERNYALQSEIETKDLLIIELKQSIAVLSRQKSSDRLSKDSSLTGVSMGSIGANGVVETASMDSNSDTVLASIIDDQSNVRHTSTTQYDDERTESGKQTRKVTWSIRKENVVGNTHEDESEVFLGSNGSQDDINVSRDSAKEQQTTSELRLTPKSRIPACDEVPGNFSSSFQSDEEKARILSEMKETSPILWKADHVRAWLELEVHLPGYGKACSENIRSGRVLLSLSDLELNSCLGLQSPLHRRKLRLAIDELRQPEMTYPLVSTVTPAWVAKYWLPSLGLGQFSSTFETQLVDGRLLNVLTKKDLEKHLSVLQKLHQSSIVCGIKLLKSLSFDTRALTERRTKAVENNNDLIVWTNEQIVNWIKSIDLGEFAENLQNSGIHGGLFVLDSNFTVDVLSRQLKIPSSKVPVLRHLSTELKLLLASATSKTKDSSNAAKRSSLARSPFIRSFRGGKSSADDLSRQNRGSEKSFTWRGSLGRAFSKKISKDQIRVIRPPDQNVVKSLPNIDDSARQAEDGRRKRDRLI